MRSALVHWWHITIVFRWLRSTFDLRRWKLICDWQYSANYLNSTGKNRVYHNTCRAQTCVDAFLHYKHKEESPVCANCTWHLNNVIYSLTHPFISVRCYDIALLDVDSLKWKCKCLYFVKLSWQIFIYLCPYLSHLVSCVTFERWPTCTHEIEMTDGLGLWEKHNIHNKSLLYFPFLKGKVPTKTKSQI